MPLFRRSTRLCFDLYSICSPGACYAWKNRLKPWTNQLKPWKLNENYGKSMKTLGKSMNTVEKASETMETSMNSANGNCLLQISAKYRTGFCSKMQIARKSAPDWKTKQNKNNSPKNLHPYVYIYILLYIYLYLYIYLFIIIEKSHVYLLLSGLLVWLRLWSFRVMAPAAGPMELGISEKSLGHIVPRMKKLHIFSPSGFRLKRGEIVPRRFLQLRIF